MREGQSDADSTPRPLMCVNSNPSKALIIFPERSLHHGPRKHCTSRPNHSTLARAVFVMMGRKPPGRTQGKTRSLGQTQGRAQRNIYVSWFPLRHIRQKRARLHPSAAARTTTHEPNTALVSEHTTTAFPLTQEACGLKHRPLQPRYIYPTKPSKTTPASAPVSWPSPPPMIRAHEPWTCACGHCVPDLSLIHI